MDRQLRAATLRSGARGVVVKARGDAAAMARAAAAAALLPRARGCAAPYSPGAPLDRAAARA